MIYKTLIKAGENWLEKLNNLLEKTNFQNREVWQERYFTNMPEEYISENITVRLLDFFYKRQPEFTLYTGWYNNYLQVDNEIYLKILAILTVRREEDTSFRYELPMKFFEENRNLLQLNFGLCEKAYFQQDEMPSRYDQLGSEFILLFEVNQDILPKYIERMIESHKMSFFTSNFKQLNNLWQFSNADQAILMGLVQIAKAEIYRASDHTGAIFFINLDTQYHKRAVEVLKQVMLSYPKAVKILNIVFDIVRNCLKQFLEEVITFYLSLDDDINVFSKLQWNNNHFSSSSHDSIWADFKAAELQTIYSVVNRYSNEHPYRYLQHLEDLQGKIAQERRQGSWERKMRFRRLHF